MRSESVISLSWVQTASNIPVNSLSMKLYPHCLAQVGSRNRYMSDFAIKLK